MAVQVPTPEQVKAAAAEVGLSLTDADIQTHAADTATTGGLAA